jgi:predicted nucleotidyltransferase
MNDNYLLEALLLLANQFNKHEIKHALIGGMAVSYRGFDRATKDVDFIVHPPALKLPALLEELVEQGFEIDVIEAIKKWSAERFIVFWRGRVRVDWMQPILPIYANVMNEADMVSYGGANINIATSEGIVLTKMLAFRRRDQDDIETIIQANRRTFNADLVRQEWAFFAPTQPERTAWIEELFAKYLPKS